MLLLWQNARLEWCASVDLSLLQNTKNIIVRTGLIDVYVSSSEGKEKPSVDDFGEDL